MAKCRYLVGPVGGAAAADRFEAFRRSGECLTFAPDGAGDIIAHPNDTWSTIASRLPSGWFPDFIAVNLAYTTTPLGIWSSQVPLVGIAPEWALLWHSYLLRAAECELLLTDAEGVNVFSRAGVSHTETVCWAFTPIAEGPSNADTESERDIDVLFAGNLNPAIQPAKLPVLGQIVDMGRRRRIVVRQLLDGPSYQRLLRRAKTAFVFDSPGISQQPILDAIGAGALVFRFKEKADSRDSRTFGECVVDVCSEQLESTIERILDDPAERKRRLGPASDILNNFQFDTQWAELVERIRLRLPSLRSSSKSKPPKNEKNSLLTRVWQTLGSTGDKDTMLVRDLERRLDDEPNASSLHNAAGLALARSAAGTVPVSVMSQVVAEHFRRGADAGPANPLIWLNLAEAEAAAGQKKEAIEHAKRALVALERDTGSDAERDAALRWTGHFEPGFGVFRVNWERCGWENAGSLAVEMAAKKRLIRWQIHRFLAAQTKNLSHSFEALLAEPNDLSSRASVALGLSAANQPIEALAHARIALRQNPFDAEIARLCYFAQGHIGNPSAQESLVDDRRLFFRACPSLVAPEPWFFDRPPSDDELASIIVLCCNEVEFTRQCVESVLRHTRGHFELILIDNGSTDDTAAYLRELSARKLKADVRIVTNEVNKGFAIGCNQGVAASRGRYVVFLNNDTIVTPGWLDEMIGWVARDWPRIGMVGPTSNYAPQPQYVRGDYQSMEELDKFAERRRKIFESRSLRVRRLTGFCLLIRREVLEQVGAFDTRFGIGFFEDDDLGLRVAEAGYELVLAQNVFIHHYGSRTFKGLGLDTTSQLRENFDRFQDKWGKDESHTYRFPSDPARPLPDVPLLPDKLTSSPQPSNGSGADLLRVATPPRVSLSMIVRNEEANLPGCLESVAGLFDEIVIADTGSSDRTKEIAASFGAKVVDFPWIDNFGAARSHSLKHVTGRWVVWLDADDRLDEENRKKLKAVFDRLENGIDCYSLRVRSLVNKANDTYQALDQVRLFPNHPDAGWEYRVHEQIYPSLRRLGSVIVPTDVVIDHIGYQEHATRRKKLERNIRLIELDHQERPDDPFTLFYLGWTSMDLGKYREILGHFERAIEKCSPDSSLLRKLFALVVQVHRRLNERIDATRVCREGLSRFSDDAELLHEMAMLNWDKQAWETVETCLAKVLRTRSRSYFSSLDEGLQGYRTRHLLGLVYQEQQRCSEAEIQWRAIVAERVKFLPAWQGLGDLFIRQRRWADLDVVIRTLAAEDLVLDAETFRGQAALARREFHSAQRIFEQIVGANPKAVRPRMLLAQAYLQEGKDPAKSEKSLRDALDLDPNNQALRHNLEVFLREHRAGVKS